MLISNISNIMIHGHQGKLIKNLFIQFIQYKKIEKKNKPGKSIQNKNQHNNQRNNQHNN